MISFLPEHESFLRSIFDCPEDDLPRLVYADFLEENGEPDRAQLIRAQVERARLRRDPAEARARPRLRDPRLRSINHPAPAVEFDDPRFDRGFPPPAWTVRVSVAELSDPVQFRETAVRKHPEWFGAVELQLTRGTIASAAPFETVFGTLAFANVNHLDLRGQGRWEARRNTDQLNPAIRSIVAEFVREPGVTAAGLQALCQCPGSERLTGLNLTQNQLNDEAAGPLLDSPHLGKLTRLDIRTGNRIGDLTWARLVDRFGPHVVG